MKKTIAYFVLILNILAITALFISYLSVYIPPDKFWISSFFGLAFPFFVAANILFIGIWAFFKPKFLFLSLVAVLVGWGFVNRYFQFSGKNTENEGIEVVSYNVQNFPGKKESDQKATADKILEFLDEKNANIICMQEIRLRNKRIFNIADVVNRLKSIKHYHYASNGATFGLATFTSYPIIKMGEIRYQKSPNMAIFTDVLIGADTVRIFNVHLQSYNINPEKYDIIDSPGIDEEKDIKEMREIGSKLKRAFKIRAAQVREIRQVIDETPYPVIICGDFNDTPVSYSYQLLRDDFKDAFVESGKGFVRTYIGKLPSYRIDNIFYSDTFESYNFNSENFRISDHLPVSCLLVKK
ncbi:MAG TPA: endonuclease/exonuclease/phosphatase family protein [Draconibacterium sp.]|nr:endonuclease/exonuclease/phosphatase family protein [Draconibacterium sp.]